MNIRLKIFKLLVSLVISVIGALLLVGLGILEVLPAVDRQDSSWQFLSIVIWVLLNSVIFTRIINPALVWSRSTRGKLLPLTALVFGYSLFSVIVLVEATKILFGELVVTSSLLHSSYFLGLAFVALVFYSPELVLEQLVKES